MVDIGLTGGIGAGKSTVAALLAEHGAVVLDADAFAREALAPGSEGAAEVERALGPGLVRADGSMDRAALAALVFADPQARARLESIVHPLVRQQMARRRAQLPADAVVVHDIPLLVETGRAGEFDLVVVVEAAVDVRLSRLASRKVPEADARARMAAQASAAARAEVADVVIHNDGELSDLEGQVAALWARIQAGGSRDRASVGGPS